MCTAIRSFHALLKHGIISTKPRLPSQMQLNLKWHFLPNNPLWLNPSLHHLQFKFQLEYFGGPSNQEPRTKNSAGQAASLERMYGWCFGRRPYSSILTPAFCVYLRRRLQCWMETYSCDLSRMGASTSAEEFCLLKMTSRTLVTATPANLAPWIHATNLTGPVN